MNIYKFIFNILIAVSTVLLISQTVIGQPAPELPDGPEQAPLPGLAWLLAAGIGYSIHKLIQKEQ